MNFKIDSYEFRNVRIPVIWGSRLILQDADRALSVINLEAGGPALEIIRNHPAPGVGFLPTWAGFQIMRFPRDLYEFNVLERSFTSPTLDLPDVQIDELYIRVGSQIFPNVAGLGEALGLQVTSAGVVSGVPIPTDLAALAV